MLLGVSLLEKKAGRHEDFWGREAQKQEAEDTLRKRYNRELR